MVIVELYGLPGAGKTTEIIRIMEYLEKKNLDFFLVRPIENTEDFNGNVIKFNKLSLLLRPRYIVLSIKLFIFLRKEIFFNEYFSDVKENIKTVLRQIMYLGMYNKNKFDGFLLSDQGLFQELSGFIMNPEKLNSCLDILECEMKENEIMVLLIESTLELSQKRINLRKRCVSQMDYFEDSVFYNYLIEYQKNIKSVTEKHTVYTSFDVIVKNNY